MRNRTPHHHIGSSLSRHRLLHAASQLPAHVRQATALLGPDHQLVRVVELAAVLSRQLLVTALTLAAGGIAFAFDAFYATALIAAAAAVELLLVSAAAVLAAKQRSLVQDLLLSGQGHLPLRALERERARLSRPGTRAHLARSLDRLVDSADGWPHINRNCRPVFDVRVIRAAAPLLTEIATLLRGQPTPEQTLQIEHLLSNGSSALYGQDPDELIRQLEHLKRQLQQSGDAVARGCP